MEGCFENIKAINSSIKIKVLWEIFLWQRFIVKAKIYLLLRHLTCVIHLESGANPQSRKSNHSFNQYILTG